MNSSQQEPGQKRISRRSFLLWVTGAGALILGDGLLWEPRAFQVQELNLSLAKIPPGREIRIVHLSDLHIRSFHNYFKRVAGAVQALDPELILLTGDYLELQRNLDAVRQFLELLQAPEGIYAVQGNWEYWARVEGENLRNHFARWWTTLLINERYDLELREVPLSILGLDYPSSSDALNHLQQQTDPGRVNLLLSHVPAFNHEILDDRIDLILCGHTHGGQVRLPFLPPPCLPRFSGRFVSGLYQVGPGTPLYVTRGVGTSVFPVRFLCRPEITLLRLHAACRG
jgi:predicted MPP superfamily phosphohydrolase